MLRALLPSWLGLLAAVAAPLHAAADPAAIQRFVTTYCIECHGPEKQKADRRFDALQLPAAKEDTLLALKDILDQLHLGERPPAEARVGTPGSSAEGFSLVTPRALTRLLSMKAATEFTLIMAKSICPPATSADAPLQPL
jgi:hypothetical protein